MKRVPVEITGITLYPPYHGYMLILHETEGLRWLPIFIGQQEAQTISNILKGSKGIRPLTFDLITNLLDSVGSRVEEVVVTDLRDQTFFAEVILRLNGGGIRQVDARPSDAIALALRLRAPIYIEERVMQEAGQSEQIVNSEELQQGLIGKLETLNRELQLAVDQEAYEDAAKLRDQIRQLASLATQDNV